MWTTKSRVPETRQKTSDSSPKPPLRRPLRLLFPRFSRTSFLFRRRALYYMKKSLRRKKVSFSTCDKRNLSLSLSLFFSPSHRKSADQRENTKARACAHATFSARARAKRTARVASLVLPLLYTPKYSSLSSGRKSLSLAPFFLFCFSCDRKRPNGRESFLSFSKQNLDCETLIIITLSLSLSLSSNKKF